MSEPEASAKVLASLTLQALILKRVPLPSIRGAAVNKPFG
jgi:hypothetical protein